MAGIRKPRPDLAERNKGRATHRMSGTRIYKIWIHIIGRCTNPNDKDYPRYGGRGITVSDEWRKFENFYADMGDKPEGMQIDRINNDKGYSRENCRWATPSENSRNRRSARIITFKGISKPLVEWAQELGICSKALRYRLETWGIEKALTTPYVPRVKA